MNDILGRLYNGFLLRDLLGYMIPGSFVFACLIHLVSIITNSPLDQLFKVITGNGYAYFLSFSLCYACGHFLSGIFFHTAPFGKIFNYSPKELLNDYPNMSFDKAWGTHRFKYREACGQLSDSMQGLIERHAALLHFTGHFSAGIIFTAIYILCFSIYSSSLKSLAYELPLAIVFPGIFSHYRRLKIERYNFERSAIEASHANTNLEMDHPDKK